MLIVPNKRADACVLHVIVGPETQLYQDIHGAAEIDITEILEALPKDAKSVRIRLSRSLSESRTASELAAGDMPFAFSVAGAVPPPAAAPAQPQVSDVSGIMNYRAAAAVGVCEGCESLTGVENVGGRRLCRNCAAGTEEK